MPKIFSFKRFENFLDSKNVNALYDFVIENQDKFEESKVYRNDQKTFDPTTRVSLTCSDVEEFREIFINKIKENFEIICQSVRIPTFDVVDYEVQMAAHGHGAFFKHHIDTQSNKKLSRVISVVFYFFFEPKKFKGGELVLYPLGFLPGNDSPVTLEPLNNSLVVFPSFAPHEVLPVDAPNLAFEHYRFSVNCWILK